jgi:hypothetical protein
MSDPLRLVRGAGTAFEQQLLTSVLDEPVPEHLHLQMAAGVGLLPLAPGSEALVGSALKAQVQTHGGLSLFKIAALGLGLSGVGAAGFGVWYAAQPEQPARVVQSAQLEHSVHASESEQAAQVVEPSSAQLVNDRLQGPRLNPQSGAGIVDESQPTPVRSTQDSPVRSAAARPVAKLGATAPNTGAGEYVEQELRLLDPARAALKRGDRARATRLLDEYDRLFVQGTLRREANVLRGLTQAK